jgi:predicted MPP superfamily phosphohydrolase
MSEPTTPADPTPGSVRTRWERRWERLRPALGASWRWSVRAVRHPVSRRAGRGLLLLVVTLAGMTAGLLVGGHTSADVGPFHAQFSLQPSLAGDTEVDIPPLGSLVLDSHDGPLHLVINLGSLDRTRTEQLVRNPDGIDDAGQDAIGDLKAGVTGLAVQSAAACLLGGLIAGALVYRRPRRILLVGGLCLALVGGTAGWTAATFRPDSIEEPRYEGLLTMAPSVVGDARTIVNGYGHYAKELQALVDNVSKLYGTLNSLPVYQPSTDVTRVLHISDMHLNPSAWDVIDTVVKQYHVNLIVDTGDIVDWGSSQEDAYFAHIHGFTVPYVYIRGNHDSAATAAAVARQGAIVLENQVRTVDGITFAGIGDPRFTPDKETEPADPKDPEPKNKIVTDSGDTLADTIDSYDATRQATGNTTNPLVDVALVHDPLAAQPLDGHVPLALAGHRHQREVEQLDDGTLLMVQGSTGGAGLRGLQQKTPTPLDLSVLYFDPQHKLQAYDDISVGGTGRSEVTLQRHIVAKPTATGAPSGSTSASVTPTPTSSRR